METLFPFVRVVLFYIELWSSLFFTFFECFTSLDKHLLPALLQSQSSMNSASAAPVLHPSSSSSEGYVCCRVELM